MEFRNHLRLLGGRQQVLLCVFRKQEVVCHDGSPGASPKHRTPAPAEAGAIQQACVPVFSGGAIVPGLVALTEGCTAGGPATKALGDMNAVKAALPL